jgi:DNA-binding response OmpR family regulator
VRTRPTVLFFAPAERPVPDLLVTWAAGKPLPVLHLSRRIDVELAAVRSLPALIVVAEEQDGEGRALCRVLKTDPYTGIIPVAILSGRHGSDQTRGWFEAGADEVITPLFDPREQRFRLDALLARAETSVSVHPSTRLAGTTEIEREIRRRLDAA